jgi:pilus assembly protein CpaC
LSKLIGSQFLKFVFWLLFLQPTLSNGAESLASPDSSAVTAADEAAKSKQVVIRASSSPKKSGVSAVPYTQGFYTEIEMFVGETRVINEANAGRLAVGNGTALSAAVLDDKEILLIANDAGVSSLHIWTKDGKNRRIKVTVVPGESARISKEVAAFLKTIPKSKATLIGDKVVVEGEGMSDNDLAKIEVLSKRYPQIINFTNRQGWEKMIAMDVKVVEFPTKFLREIGIKWGATGGGAIGAIWQPVRYNNDGPFQINQISGTQNAAPITGPGKAPVSIPNGLNVLSVLDVGFNAQLNMLEQNGTAVILARPTLSTRSGTNAKFLAGGEFPYSVSNINGTTIAFKPYGIKLDIEPTVDQNGLIRAKIFSEISDIDASVSTNSGPALRTRKTESEFNVMDGQTIVLSGLLSRDKSVSIDKLPFLGDIPILGALFRSKRYQNSETELVVFVTPIASEKHSQNQQEAMDKATSRLQNESVEAAKAPAQSEQKTDQLTDAATPPVNAADTNPAVNFLTGKNPY